jgi:hypothetical protein
MTGPTPCTQLSVIPQRYQPATRPVKSTLNIIFIRSLATCRGSAYPTSNFTINLYAIARSLRDTGSGCQSVYILPSRTTQLATCIPPEHLTRSSGFKQSRDACIFETKMSSSLKSLPEQNDESSLRPMIDVCCDGGGGRKRLRRQANHYCSHAPDLLASSYCYCSISFGSRSIAKSARCRRCSSCSRSVTGPGDCPEQVHGSNSLRRGGGGEGIEWRHRASPWEC